MKLQDLAVSLFTIAFGLGFIAMGAQSIVPHVQQTQDAEAVDAEVVSSELVFVSGGTQSGGGYMVNVTYQYTYDGTTYTSSSVFPGDDHEVDRSRGERIVENHSAGEQVTAYVDADDPERAFLIDEEPPWYYYVLPLIGGLIGLMGLKTLATVLRGGELPAG